MAYRQKIMIVDNDENIAELISLYLRKECYDTVIITDGQSALDQFDDIKPDLIILDLMLPGIDGYQVCRTIRQRSSISIIMLSAKSEIFDRVLGLELGADDYIVKPFDTKELTARVKAVLRRTDPEFIQMGASRTKEDGRIPKVVSYPGLTINLTNYSVQLMGKEIEMPPKELELLYFLASSPNQVFTRDQLLSQIWGYDYAGDTRTVDVHIKRLREKLNQNSSWSIRTVWGVGYKFNYAKR